MLCEGEVFLRGERGFQRIPVPDPMEALREGGLADALRPDRPGLRLQASREEREERGFAGAVAPRDHQRFTLREGEGQA